jgi:hypothetical protein
MSPRFWHRAAKAHDHTPFRNVECLAEELQETLERQPSGSARAQTVKGELAGLKAKGVAPVRPGALSGTADYRAGFLGGHLLATLMRDGRALRPQVLVCAVKYGHALVEPPTQEMLALPAPENAIAAHTVAWPQAVDRSGRLDPELRLAAFGWLCDGLGVTISAERRAALEDRWLERELCRDPEPSSHGVLGRRHPVAAIRVTVGPPAGQAIRGGGRAGPQSADSPSFAFDLTDKAWRAAAARRNEVAVNPLTDPEMRGFLELRSGGRAILSKPAVSVFAAVCGLAHARARGFPYDHPICIVDDCTGSWALHMVRDPGQPVVQVTEIYRGATVALPIGTLADLVDSFVARFAGEAARRIPDLTGWGELAVLAGYLPE